MGWNPFGDSGSGGSGGSGASENVRYTIEQSIINNKKVFRLKQTINGITSYVGMNITFDANDITYTSEYATTVNQALNYLYEHNINKAITNIEFTESSVGNTPNQPGAIDTYEIIYNDNTKSTFKIYNGLNGKQGNDGKSAYDIWIDNGNLGTAQDFLNSLVGQNGISISNAIVNSTGHLIITLDNDTQIDAGYVKGADGTSVNIKGELNNIEELPTTANNGDGYIINGNLWVYVDSSWVDAGTIKGPQGETGNGIKSINFTSSSIGTTAGIAGATDTYTITFTNGEITTFVVYNGQNGMNGSIAVDTEMSDTSTNAVQNKVIKTYVDNIVGNIQTILETLVTVE